MIQFLLALTLLAQAAPVLQSDNGSISGLLKTSSGAPAVGVRVAAMAVPDSTLGAAIGAAMVSLVATDEAGRYLLENIPPGRYYIVAGRVDLPTYFPGTLEMPGGTIVSVTAKAAISGLNFALQDSSVRIPGNDFNLAARLVPALPVRVIVENGAKQPVSADGNFVSIGLERTGNGPRNDAPLDAALTSVPIPALSAAGAEYRVTVDNLPDGYILKSMTYGSTDIMTDTLKLTTANALMVNPLIPSVVTIITTNNGVPVVYTGGIAPTNAPGGPIGTIIVTLGTVPPSIPPPAGVRITGQAPVRGSWSIYRGNIPGTFYADGTFELRGVPPGRHIIVLQENSAAPRFFAAVANVGDQDLNGVTLDSTGLLPSSILIQPTTAAAGTFQGSSSTTLAGLLGRVLEAEGGKPIPRGVVTVLGRTVTTVSVRDGEFVIPRLLPGSYDLRIEAFEHFTLYETVDIGDTDVHQDFKVRSNPETPPEVTSER